MTVSKAFWKIVLKNLGMMAMYTGCLISFGTITADSSSTTIQFEATKPSIVIFNHDEEQGVTKGLIEYLNENAKVETEYSDDDKLKDALFYENVVMVVDIPENYHEDFAEGKNPEIHTRTSAGYRAELAKVVLSNYLNTAKSYTSLNLSENELIEKADSALESKTEVEILSKVDSAKYAKAASYFNFANYSILACLITIICLIMSSFNRLEIRKRNLVSSIKISKMNRALIANCCLYSFAVWLLYLVIGYFIADGENLINVRGALYAANSFVFCICATTIAFTISQLVSSKNAINGIMNVVALGSSFLAGGFVPAEYMPDSVLVFAHVLPSYYYIQSNNKIMALEGFSLSEIAPVLINIGIILGFSVLLILVANIISKKKQHVA